MSLLKLLSSMATITEFELRKLRHDYSQVFMRVIQPALWLLIFGEVFSKIRVLPNGNADYLQFLTPGVLAQSVVFVAIFYGLMLVWERDLGMLQKLMSTPTPRYSIVVGKAFSAGVRSVFQAIVVLILALIMRVNLNISPLSVIGVLVIIVMSGMCFSSLSILLASLLKTRERMMGIGQAITMPLFFASSAIYPIDLMPDWLRVVAQVNPLSYIVDAMRTLLVTGEYSHLAVDLGAVFLATFVITSLASLSFRRIIS
ncbi:MAG: ABC transporter permease [Dehalococcoidia bacterium]|nr:ABC transporter permease [Dehalococcoidia bacterium]